jgi:aminocarboxymuconate-semialdehyde decarboxylase
MRKLDIFNHIYPTPFHDQFMKLAPTYKDIGKRMRNIPMLADLDVRFRVMDTFGDDYQQVFSLPTPPIEVFAKNFAPSVALDLARAANDGMAELVQKYPARFPGFVAALPLGQPDAALAELHRAVDDLGARGFQITSNILGKPITAAEFLPLFEAMAKYDLPIWMHPFRGPDFADYQTEDRSQFEIWWTFGWPYDTSVAMARLVFEGYFDRFPNLKIIAHHMGAMIPYFEGRLGPGMDQLGSRTSDIDYTAVLKSLKKRPLDYFKMFYADTAVFGAYDATVCGLKFFGVDHVLFSSDAPFDPEQGPMYIRETIKIVDRLEISEADREKIYWRNSAALLKLEAASPR